MVMFRLSHMKRKHIKDSRRILNIPRGAIPLAVNVTEDKDVANQQYPEFLEETMFADHGTKVLITDPKADVYLERAKQQKLDKLKDKYEQWWEEPEGDPSY